MTEADVRMIRQLGKTVEHEAGKTASRHIMQGSEQIAKSSSKETIALWVRGAMDRLDSTVDEQTRVRIMESCGRNCAFVNNRVIEAAKQRRKKSKDIDSFLDAEQRKPMKGTRLSREENILYQSYVPQSFAPPMRCYCSLLRGLPKDTSVSSTYCHCSKAFVQKLWEGVLGRPVKVDLLQSVVSGGSECTFAIHLP